MTRARDLADYIAQGVSATELDILDGLTATTAELNILDGKSFVDEDNMASNSATAISSQQSIKAYVDAQTEANTVIVSDSTANTNFPVVFHNESNGLLDDTGALKYNPSTGTLIVPVFNLGDTAITATGAELNLLDGVTATTAELNALDGITAVVGELNALDIGSTAVGTAVASKAVILDSNKDYTGVRNLTISGELDAATLDVSGNVDVDGVLETDNLTIGGAQGSDGQVLTSTGSGVGWEDAAGGAWNLVDEVTVTSNVSSVDLEGMNSTYKNYAVVVSNAGMDSGENVFMRFKNGGSYDTSTIYSNTSNGARSGNNAWYIVQKENQSAFEIMNISSIDQEGHGCVMYIHNPAAASVATVIHGTWMAQESGQAYMDVFAGCYNKTSSGAVTGIRLFCNNRNWDAGNFRLYGIGG